MNILQYRSYIKRILKGNGDPSVVVWHEFSIDVSKMACGTYEDREVKNKTKQNKKNKNKKQKTKKKEQKNSLRSKLTSPGLFPLFPMSFLAVDSMFSSQAFRNNEEIEFLTESVKITPRLRN